MGRIRGNRRKAAPIEIVLITGVLAFAAGALFGSGVLREATERPDGRPWPASVQEASTKIAAVRSDGPGMICDLIVRVNPGEGRILVDTHPLVGFDFQYSERIAVKVASHLTGVALDDDGIGLKGADVLFAVSSPAGGTVEIQAIDGPSAGAAATVAVIAAIENKKVRGDVIITGTIQEDGRVGPVGGIFEKARTADGTGARLLLVPFGQSVVTMYREVVRQVGPFRWITYEPVRVDLKEYAENAGWGIRIQEVSTIEDAMKMMFE